jgi:arylsulfatase A-like enzyme
VVLCFFTSAAGAGGQASRPPNVVVILVDDLGLADLSRRSLEMRFPLQPRHFSRVIRSSRPIDLRFTGYEHDGFVPPVSGETGIRHTPHVDSLLERGIELTQYLTHARCSPSRAGLLTGRHYTRVGSGPEVGGTLQLHVSNLASDLQVEGYATGAFGKWHNGYPNFPADGNGVVVPSRNDTDPHNDQFENFKGIPWGPGVNAYGFDEWQGFYGGATDYFDRMSWWDNDINWWTDRATDYFDRMSWWDNDINWWTDRRYTPLGSGYTVDIVTSAAVDFIVRHRNEPFFCYVAMPAPHYPLHLLQSDLETISSLIPGAWQSVRGLTSPTTGRRIEDVEELRCGPDEEFDHTILDPDGTGFSRLARATLVYAMDRGIGEILTTLDDLDLSEQTVVWFASDNGGNTSESTHPFRGSKGSLYEGGIRAPAVVLWPGTLDAATTGYFNSNTYPYLFQYLDIYPTTMSMAGFTPSEADLDGSDGFTALLERAPTHPLWESTFISFNRDWAVVRGGRWKLLYNESGSRQKIELYDIRNDPLEKINIQNTRPDIREPLIGDLHRFLTERQLAMSYLVPPAAWIPAARPQPHGETLEIRITQTEGIENGDQCGLFVRFASAGIKSYSLDQLESSDVFSFDLYVAADSSLASGFFVTPAHGSTPVYDGNSGVNHTGELLSDKVWPRSKWVRATIGIGDRAPTAQTTDYIALRSQESGTYHFFLDNIAILRSDGSSKAEIWASGKDTLPLRFRYCGETYGDWESVAEVAGFPFSELSVRAID